MKPLDHNLQRRVWARVYDGGPQPLSPQRKQMVRQALRRSRENLAVYEKLQKHAHYGAAFTKMQTETTEHIKMLQQMLR